MRICLKKLEFMNGIETYDEECSTNIRKYKTKNPLKKYVIANFLDEIITKLRECCAKSVLDVGSGEGIASEMIRKNVTENIDMLDVSIDNLKIAKNYNIKSNIICGSIYNLPFHDNAYDTIMCLEVLEHLEEPEKALKEIKRVSRSYAIISVPYTLIFRIGNLFSLKNLSNFGEAPDHKISFNKGTFERMLQMEFEHVEVTKKHFWLIGKVKI